MVRCRCLRNVGHKGARRVQPETCPNNPSDCRGVREGQAPAHRSVHRAPVTDQKSIARFEREDRCAVMHIHLVPPFASMRGKATSTAPAISRAI